MSNSDLSACLSHQPRRSVSVQENTSYKTEDLSQYLAKPAKEEVQIIEEVIIETVEVSIVTESMDLIQHQIELSSPICGFTPCVHNTVNKLQWRQWVMKSKALSKEYKLLLFESWMAEAA